MHFKLVSWVVAAAMFLFATDRIGHRSGESQER